MKFFKKRYFILLAGLLFVTSVSSDSFLHEFSDDLAYESDCHLCIIEIGEENQSFTIQNKVFKASIAIEDLNEDFVLIIPNSYYSRAPPKI